MERCPLYPAARTSSISPPTTKRARPTLSGRLNSVVSRLDVERITCVEGAQNPLWPHGAATRPTRLRTHFLVFLDTGRRSPAHGQHALSLWGCFGRIQRARWVLQSLPLSSLAVSCRRTYAATLWSWHVAPHAWSMTNPTRAKQKTTAGPSAPAKDRASASLTPRMEHDSPNGRALWHSLQNGPGLAHSVGALFQGRRRRLRRWRVQSRP